MAHTPGPWFSLTGNIVSTTVGPHWAANEIAEVKRNEDLQLIAAAPDLLQALELCMGYAGAGIIANELGKQIKLEQIRDTARAAIDRAKS